MKLSEQLYKDFLQQAYPDNMVTRTYKMSWDYLIDLINKVKTLEGDNTQMNIRDVATTTDIDRKIAMNFLDTCDPLFAALVKLQQENKFLKESLEQYTKPVTTPELGNLFEAPSGSLEVHPEMNAITVKENE